MNVHNIRETIWLDHGHVGLVYGELAEGVILELFGDQALVTNDEFNETQCVRTQEDFLETSATSVCTYLKEIYTI